MKHKIKNICIAIAVFFFCGMTYSYGYHNFFESVKSRVNYNTEQKVWLVTIFPLDGKGILKNYTMDTCPVSTENSITIIDSFGNIELIVGFPYIITESTENIEGMDSGLYLLPNSIENKNNE